MSTSKNFVPKPSGTNPEPQPGRHRHVLERPVAVIHVERVQLFREVRDEDIGKAVAVDVGAVDAHAGLRLAVAVEPDACAIRDVVNVPLPLLRYRKLRTVSFAT